MTVTSEQARDWVRDIWQRTVRTSRPLLLTGGRAGALAARLAQEVARDGVRVSVTGSWPTSLTGVQVDPIRAAARPREDIAELLLVDDAPAWWQAAPDAERQALVELVAAGAQAGVRVVLTSPTHAPPFGLAAELDAALDQGAGLVLPAGPMEQPPEAPPAAAGLTSEQMMAAQLCRAAGLPVGRWPLVVPGAPTTWLIQHPERGRAVVLLADGTTTVTAARLAHEVAHLADLDAPAPAPRWARALDLAVCALVLAGGVVLAAAGHAVAGVLTLAAYAAADAYMTRQARHRRSEIAADLAGAELLEQCGLDGHAATRAALAAAAASDPEPWWIRCGGWVATAYPTLRARHDAMDRRQEP